MWEDIWSSQDMIQRAFRKCGISVAIDGLEDHELYIEDLEDYIMDTDDEYTDIGDDPFSDDPCVDIDKTESD